MSLKASPLQILEIDEDTSAMDRLVNAFLKECNTEVNNVTYLYLLLKEGRELRGYLYFHEEWSGPNTLLVLFEEKGPTCIVEADKDGFSVPIFVDNEAIYAEASNSLNMKDVKVVKFGKKVIATNVNVELHTRNIRTLYSKEGIPLVSVDNNVYFPIDASLVERALKALRKGIEPFTLNYEKTRYSLNCPSRPKCALIKDTCFVRLPKEYEGITYVDVVRALIKDALVSSDELITVEGDSFIAVKGARDFFICEKRGTYKLHAFLSNLAFTTNSYNVNVASTKRALYIDEDYLFALFPLYTLLTNDVVVINHVRAILNRSAIRVVNDVFEGPLFLA